MKRLSLLLSLILLLNLTISPSYASPSVYRYSANPVMQIALTFDDGPHPGRTPEILSILKRYGIKATFFVVGQNVEYYPKAFSQIVDEGHEIGSHTYSHAVLKNLSLSEIENDDLLFNKAVKSIYSGKVSLIRPPEGSFSESLIDFANSNNYRIILWSVDTLDWTHKDPNNIANSVISEAKNGDIILMHDFISGKSPTPAALETIIPALLDKGFSFVTVSELLS